MNTIELFDRAITVGINNFDYQARIDNSFGIFIESIKSRQITPIKLTEFSIKYDYMRDNVDMTVGFLFSEGYDKTFDFKKFFYDEINEYYKKTRLI